LPVRRRKCDQEWNQEFHRDIEGGQGCFAGF
jgi:hypothetical protein